LPAKQNLFSVFWEQQRSWKSWCQLWKTENLKKLFRPRESNWLIIWSFVSVSKESDLTLMRASSTLVAETLFSDFQSFIIDFNFFSFFVVENTENFFRLKSTKENCFSNLFSIVIQNRNWWCHRQTLKKNSNLKNVF
jgi:hypothetical protein